MLTQVILCLLVALAGIGLTLQIAWNARLRIASGSAVLATMISVLITLLSLILLWASGAMTRGTMPSRQSLPIWAWCGGICGAYYLMASLMVIPRLGAAAGFSLVIAGQMLSALVLDSTGAFGTAYYPLSMSRVLGTGLLIAGVVLLQKA